ncbi:MAG: type II toxin-antitoxin system VapC family toxin [Magnetococcus sp. YQC-5]
MGYLIDTNVLAELRKGKRCNPGVLQWHANVEEPQIYIPVVVLGEIRHGIELLRRRDPKAAQWLEDWLTALRVGLGSRLLPITPAIADLWGRLGVPDAIPTADGLLASTALVHDLTLVTRNIRDMARTGARLMNPFIDQ